MMAWIQNCIFLVKEMAGEIKSKNVGCCAGISVLMDSYQIL